jgi:hypothetical protein
MDDGIGVAQESIEVAGVDEGVGAPVPEPVAEATEVAKPPAGYEGVPKELWPDKDGNPPPLTPALMKRLRGKYFTVRHTSGECGHKIDAINQPKLNCHDCWAAFFASHPQLVEVAHQFYTTQGRNPMVAMRGEKFVKMFEKYMALLYRAHIERLKQQEKTSVENPEPGSTSDNGAVVSGETSGVTEG